MDKHHFIRIALNWLEVWAPLIPIAFWISIFRQRKIVSPTWWYFIAAVLLNVMSDIMWMYKMYMPPYLQDNNWLYNLQSILRTIIFLVYFHRLLHRRFRKIIAIAGISYGIAIVTNYSFIQNFSTFSSVGFTLESVVLLLTCILYLFNLLADDTILYYRQEPSFWIAVGLIVYEACNFAIFIIYTQLMVSFANFAFGIWDVHNAFFLLFCILTAIGYYGCRKK